MTSQRPDSAEERLADDLDDAVPTRGYQLQRVVALGGSAGAIPALVAFLQATVPEGLAYVVILHLAPEHESTLAQLLQEHTPMPVVQVRETVAVRPDTVYVIPPRHALQMVDGDLRLAAMPADRPGRVAVDLFFRTLADTHGPHATAIVLSGMDSDGAIGIKRIRERGGLTIAQDPQEAPHDGMPRAAIATGMVDWVLPVQEMPRRLARYADLERQLSLPPEQRQGGAPESTQAESELREVLAFLRTRTGRDFANYKRATIVRRIGRRMQVNGVHDLAGYLACLRSLPGEPAALLQDLLISVTNFFRDPECFEALERQLAALFREKAADGVIRVWVAACATGEEAYSIAILLAEQAGAMDSPPAVRIFATDLDEEAIRVAREGVYPATIAADVSGERLRRFFTKEHRGYRVRRELREQVLFAVHDVLRDSPFSRVDLVSCRNLLICLHRDAQRRLFETLHFALAAEGRLFLGASETVDDNGPLFQPVDKPHRLYAPRQLPRKRLPRSIAPGSATPRLPGAATEAGTAPGVPGAAFTPAPAPPEPVPRTIPLPHGRSLSWAELHLKMLELLAPPSIVIDDAHEIMHLSPGAGRYLQFGGGEPSRNLLRAVHPALRIELRAALYQAVQADTRVDIHPLPIDVGGRPVLVRVGVRPMGEIAPRLLLVTFEAVPDAHMPADGTAAPATAAADAPSHLLERELERLKSQLRDTVEQYESSTEELKASNEELQAMNGELRSATEELETSREELQSINDELTTVNRELKSKVDELGHANSDLRNLMDATAIATVFLDRELRVTRYTPPAVALFNLLPTDAGRPLSDLSSELDYPQLGADARRVLDGLVPIEREVGDARRRWYLVRLLPYRIGEDRIAGVVLSLVDVTERKHSQQALRLSEERFGAIADKAAVGVLQAGLDGVITFVNDYFCGLLRRRGRDLIGQPIAQLVHADDRALAERKFAGLADGGSFQLEKRLRRDDGSVLWVHSSVSRVPLGEGARDGVLVVCIDISERKRAEEALRMSQERLRLVVDNATEYAIFSTDLERRVTSWNAGAERLLGWSEPEILGRTADVIFTEPDRAQDMPAREARKAAEKGCAQDERVHQRKSGERFWANGALMPMRDAAGSIVGFVKILRDQTRERLAHEALAASRNELVQALEDNQRARRQLEAADLAKDRFLAVLSHELRNPLAAVSGATAVLADPAQPEPRRERARDILGSQIEAMKRLLDDLLDISRLRFGRLALRRRPTPLARLVEQAVETARPLMDSRRHELRTRLPDAPVTLWVDPGRMGQVLANLLVNAARYTPEGGHIELAARTEHGQCVIDVRDDGPGLDEEALASMFDLFWRSNRGGAAAAQGMGIGLALVRSVVSLHEGSVGAASAGPGQGSTFTIRLPLDAPAADEAPPASPVLCAPAKGRDFQGLRVLVVDDNVDVAWTVAAMLSSAGLDVRTADDGAQALRIAPEFDPEVVVLDIGMAGMDGHEVARRLRAARAGRPLLLVAATGWGSEADRAASAAAGFDAHLIKPIAVGDVLGVIRESGLGAA